MSLSPVPLGIALFAGAASSIAAMALFGRTVDRIGRRPFVLASGAVIGLGIAGLAVAGGYASLIAVFTVLYGASGSTTSGSTPPPSTSKGLPDAA